MEFRLEVVQEPHLFVIGKWRRQTPDLAAALMYYYILDGNVYQTPTIHAALSARLVRMHTCLVVIESPIVLLWQNFVSPGVRLLALHTS